MAWKEQISVAGMMDHQGRDLGELAATLMSYCYSPCPGIVWPGLKLSGLGVCG